MSAPAQAVTPVKQRTGAALLADCLTAAGITVVFGVPGDTGVAFYDALRDRTDTLRHVLARDERHAVAMADGYARAANRIGAVEVSSGGGTTYAVGGLGEAYAAGIPVLVVASDIHRDSRGTGALTEIDQPALFAAVTKRTYQPTTAAEIPAAVDDAVRVATTGRPGPVAVIVGEDVLDEGTGAEPVTDPAGGTLPATRPAPDPNAVAEAARLLAAARRPALLAGSGVHTSGAYRQIAALADHGIAVATTIHGKGAIDERSPWSLGVAGNNGGNALANGYLADAEVVLLVGTRANATDTNGYTTPPRDATVIAVDIEADLAGRTYPDALRLVGDAAGTLGELAGALPVPPGEVLTARRTAVEERRARREPLRYNRSTEPGRLAPEDVLGRLAELVPAGTTVVADPGTPTPNLAEYWPVAAGRTALAPRGHGPMGYALPAAIGVSFARPGEPVVALTADGSFAMCCGELETVARFGLPLVTVQFTNDSLGWIKMLQHLYYEGRYFGVDPGPIDAVAVARACGLVAVRAHTLDELDTAVSAALTGRYPVYVDVPVPHLIDHVPPVPAWHQALDGDRTRPVY